MESGEVGTELRNTLGDGKTKESGNAEGAGKRKCGRSENAEKCREKVIKFINHRIIVGGVVAGDAENLDMLL